MLYFVGTPQFNIQQIALFDLNSLTFNNLQVHLDLTFNEAAKGVNKKIKIN